MTLSYDKIAFLLVKPPSRVISTHQIRNRKEHTALLKTAKEKKYFVYHADVERRDGKFFAIQPWIVDWESVDNIFDPSGKNDAEEVEDTGKLSCPFCGKKCSSKSGLTLHLKTKHPETKQ